MRLSVHSPVTRIPGVGDKRAEALAKLGILTVRDLLYHFPRGYQNRGAAVSLADAVRRGDAGLPSSVLLTVSAPANARMIRRGMTIIRAKAVETDYPDSTLRAELTFFNQTYLKDKLMVGQPLRVWGKFKKEGDSKICKISSPICEFYSYSSSLVPIVPVYPLGAGLKTGFITKLISYALEAEDLDSLDVLPAPVREKNSLLPVSEALRLIHRPATTDDIDDARRRFAFDDIFVTTAALAFSGTHRPTGGATPMRCPDINRFLAALPFSLTGCQDRAVRDIIADLSSSRPMKRMISGDVGSGKTAVAAAAAYVCASCGYTCALMVPTEILANQHYSELSALFESLGLKAALLTASVGAKNKREILARLAGEGEKIDLVIGTHALLSEGVVINRLGLVITDEQHRFGVMQRAALEEKAGSVHTLVMSATPIPRTLTLVMYGDLDVSVLDELPPGRLTVSTFTVDGSYRERLYGFIKKQAAEGHGTYVVCPAVEEKTDDPEEMADLFFSPGDALSDPSSPPLIGAVEHAEELQKLMPELRIGCVHGRMKNAQRDEVMKAFAAGELDVLVATTVIEVGVNVPSATLMVVENAERFGLSQLHQLRGRVGRGNAKSYCILVSDSESERARARLETMCKNKDGFKIAEEDLRQRGPGDFFAVGGVIRQSGAAASLAETSVTDPAVIAAIAGDAREIITRDPALTLPENEPLRRAVDTVLSGGINIIN